MITKQDKLSIFITFTIGMVAGFYFYLTGFTFSFSETPKENIYADFTIEGKEYGACEFSGCLSFQLLADGSYSTLISNQELGDVIKRGVIDNNLKTQLSRNIDPEGLEKQAKKRLSFDDCDFENNGTDYKFIITVEGEEYELDTCETTINRDTTIWRSLVKLWNYFQTLN